MLAFRNVSGAGIEKKHSPSGDWTELFRKLLDLIFTCARRVSSRYRLAKECWFYLRTCRNSTAVLQARLLKHSLTCFHLRNGVVIEFKGAPPWNIFQEVWRERVYDKKYPKNNPAPLRIVDVGANIGFFSLYAASRWPKASVIAYEPAPENYALLTDNIAQSRAAQVKTYPYAVANTVGHQDLYLGSEPGWHSLWSDETDQTIRVETRTLETICESIGGCIDLLKVDCEGGEYEALRGREALLASSVRHIAMEYHERHGHRVNELVEILTRAGFRHEVHPDPRFKTGMLYAHNPNLS